MWNILFYAVKEIKSRVGWNDKDGKGKRKNKVSGANITGFMRKKTLKTKS